MPKCRVCRQCAEAIHSSVAQRCRIYTQTIIHYLLFIIHLCGCAHKKAHKAAKNLWKSICLILCARYCTATVHASTSHRRSHGSTKSTFAGKYLEEWIMKLQLSGPWRFASKFEFLHAIVFHALPLHWGQGPEVVVKHRHENGLGFLLSFDDRW